MNSSPRQWLVAGRLRSCWRNWPRRLKPHPRRRAAWRPAWWWRCRPFAQQQVDAVQLQRSRRAVMLGGAALVQPAQAAIAHPQLGLAEEPILPGISGTTGLRLLGAFDVQPGDEDAARAVAPDLDLGARRSAVGQSAAPRPAGLHRQHGRDTGRRRPRARRGRCGPGCTSRSSSAGIQPPDSAFEAADAQRHPSTFVASLQPRRACRPRAAESPSAPPTRPPAAAASSSTSARKPRQHQATQRRATATHQRVGKRPKRARRQAGTSAQERGTGTLVPRRCPDTRTRP